MFSIFKWFKKTNRRIDLKAPVQLRFVKKEDGDYAIQFFNTLYDSWWTLPAESAAIHKRWSFEKEGSYGPYDLHIMTTTIDGIESYREAFTTFANIQEYFDRMNKKFEKFKSIQEIKNDLPDIIY